MNKLHEYWKNKPLSVILIIAIVLRLIAVMFAKGYGMHDDHFSVIEASQSWVDGTDYNNWLPKNQINPYPDGHSFFYVGIHYLIFSFFKLISITDPSIKMFLIRLLHALLSLVVVVTGYRIAEKLSDRKNAVQVGLLLACLWFMPFLSVRNLVEVVATPLLLLGLLMLLNTENKKYKNLIYLYSGLIMGIAFSIRFQTIVFIGGAGLAILLQKKFKETIIFGIGVLLSIVFLQSVVDIYIWGRPFAEFSAYVSYNLNSYDSYGTKNFWMYFELIPGLLIPPVGIFLFLGFFFKWKKHLVIFLPTLAFFIFHTLFPNKQERFILTVIPMFVIVGLIGWNGFVEKSTYWLKRPVLLKRCWIFFGIINFLMLGLLTTTYSKKSRVESMIYLSKYKDIKSIVVEETTHEGAQMIPQFYLGYWITEYELSKPQEDDPKDKNAISTGGRVFKIIYSIDFFKSKPDAEKPQFILFVGDENLSNRERNVKHVFPNLQFEKKIEPGFMDRLMLKLNPSNRNKPIYIYKTNNPL